MTQPTLLMVDRYDPGYSEQVEAEPVSVEIVDDSLKLTLDDGGELVFDLAELEQAITELRADERAAA